jgi:hypothetical protein
MKTLLALLVLLLTVGCASTPRPSALSQADVISMVKAGMSDEDIMRRIDASRTIFRLNSDDILFLRNQGVSDRLVTYMMDTFTRAALAEQERRYDYRWGFYYGHGYHWGHPHWWW